MSIAQPSFSTGNIIDPTKNALTAITLARQTLTDTLDRNIKQEAIAKEQARQKILDDRATAEYNNKINEREAMKKFSKGLLQDNQIRYADANTAKGLAWADKVALTSDENALYNSGQTNPTIDAKIKAQFELGKNFESVGKRETEYDKARRIAKETGTGDSLGVAKRLYELKAADMAARDKKETSATKQKTDLLTKYDTVKDDIADLSVVNKKYVKNGSSSSKSYKGDSWNLDNKGQLIEAANKTTPWFYPGEGDSGTIKKLMTYAQSKKVGPKQFTDILIPGGLGDEEKYSGGEKLIIPGNPNASDEEILNYYEDKLNAAATRNANGSKGASKDGDGFYYNTKDNSKALKLKKQELTSLQNRIDAIKTDYSDSRSAKERSADAIDELFDTYGLKLPKPKVKSKQKEVLNNKVENDDTTIDFKKIVDDYYSNPLNISAPLPKVTDTVGEASNKPITKKEIPPRVFGKVLPSTVGSSKKEIPPRALTKVSSHGDPSKVSSSKKEIPKRAFGKVPLPSSDRQLKSLSKSVNARVSALKGTDLDFALRDMSPRELKSLLVSSKTPKGTLLRAEIIANERGMK